MMMMVMRTCPNGFVCFCLFFISDPFSHLLLALFSLVPLFLQAEKALIDRTKDTDDVGECDVEEDSEDAIDECGDVTKLLPLDDTGLNFENEQDVKRVADRLMTGLKRVDLTKSPQGWIPFFFICLPCCFPSHLFPQ
jgi:hypothetical protein